MNGQDSEFTVPYHAHLIFDLQTTGVAHFGSGALISNTVVLTVAQNLLGYENWRAGLGSKNRDELLWVSAIRAVQHPYYMPTLLLNNIGLLFFEPITLSCNVYL